MMIKADSIASIRTAIDPVIGNAKAAIGEMSFLSDNKMSPEPFDFMRFKPERELQLHLDIVFDTVRRRVAPAITTAAGRPFTRTLCHSTTCNVLQSRFR